MGHKKKIRIDPLEAALPCIGVDTHAHIDGEEFSADRDEVIDRAIACGVSRIANIILHPEQYPERSALFAHRPEIFFLLGVHPDDAAGFTGQTELLMRRYLAEDPRIRAVGEIGLDYSRSDGTMTPEDIQHAVFRRQLRLARECGAPVAIHCRDAVEDTLAILGEEGWNGTDRLLWHCFGGTPELAARLAANGWYISVPGTITFKNNEAAREALPLIPKDRLLVETDCPYLAPDPWRGTRNEPAYTVFTARRIAEELGITPEDLWKRTGENARRFYGLSPLQK